MQEPNEPSYDEIRQQEIDDAYFEGASIYPDVVAVHSDQAADRDSGLVCRPVHVRDAIHELFRSS